ELLEMLHLADDHRVPEVDVGRGRVESDLDGDRLPARNLRLEVVALNQVDRAFGQEGQLFVESHATRIVVAVARCRLPVASSCWQPATGNWQLQSNSRFGTACSAPTRPAAMSARW